MSDIISCLLAKQKLGKVTQQFVDQVQERLGKNASNEEALAAAESYAKELSGATAIEFKRAVHHADLRSSLVSRIQGSTRKQADLYRDLVYEFHDKVEAYKMAAADAYLGRMREVFDTIRPDLLGRVKSYEGELQILHSVYNAPGQSLESQKLGGAVREVLKSISDEYQRLGISKTPRDWLSNAFLEYKVHAHDAKQFADMINKHADLEKLFGEGNTFIKKFESPAAYLAEVRNVMEFGSHVAPLSKGARFDAHDLVRNFYDVFKAKNAESWLEIEKVYGTSSLFATLFKTVERDSKFLGLYKLFGSKSNAGNLVNAAVRAFEEKGFKDAKLNSTLQSAVTYHYGGFEVLRPDGVVSNAINLAVSNAKNLIVASKIPGVIKQIIPSDPVFKAMSYAAKGVEDESMWSHIAHLGSTLKRVANSAENRKLAADLGLNMDFYRDYVNQVYAAENAMYGTRTTANAAAVSVRAGGVNMLTNAGRWDSHIRGNRVITDAILAVDNWDSLIQKNKDWLSRNGFTPELFNVAKKSFDEFGTKVNGLPMFDINSMMVKGTPIQKQLATVLGASLHELQNLSTPTYSVQYSKVISQLKSIHPIMVPIVDSFSTFQSFSFSVLNNHIMPNITSAKGAGYIATLAGLSTMAQLTASTLGDIAAGKNPRDWTDYKNWSQAFVGGGLFPYLGYLAGGSSSPFSLLGAPVQPLINVGKSIGNNIDRAIEGKPTQLGYDMVQALKNFVPMASHPLVQLPFERLIVDNLIAELHPKGYAQLRKMNARQDKKTGWWWRRGE